MIPVDPEAVNAPSAGHLRRKAKALGVALGILAAVAAAAPWIVPLSGFIRTIEARASTDLGQSVHIGGLRLHLLPFPQLSISDLTAGDAAELRVERVIIRPSLLHLFADVKVVEEIKVQRVSVSDRFVRGLARRSGSREPVALRVRCIRFEDAELKFAGFRLADLAGSVRFDPSGRIVEIRATHQNDRLALAAVPSGNTFAVKVSARNWTSPVGPAIKFERLAFNAVLTRRAMVMQEVSARLYGGSVSGPLRVSWDGGWSIAGSFDVEGVEVQPLASLLSYGAISGRLRAAPTFSARAAKPQALLANLQLDSEFSVTEGILSRVDLEAAAKNPFRQNAAPDGQTRFDALSGHVVVDAQGYHFSPLHVASGFLDASGDLSVARDHQLDGRIEIALKGTGSLIGVPLRVTGTVQTPSVLPTKGAVAGVLAGSVLLPGIGTAIGLKAGQLTENLFRWRRRETGSGITGAK